MRYPIVAITEAHIGRFREAVDAVARERRYLALLKAPSEENTRKYVEDNIRTGWPHFVALDGERVIGWCDIHSLQRDIFAHAGVLGMGIVDGYRGQGIGEALMRATLAAAKARGLTRVELSVREHNLRAKKLYEKFGFVEEGVKRRGVRVDGVYEDLICMARLFEEQ